MYRAGGGAGADDDDLTTMLGEQGTLRVGDFAVIRPEGTSLTEYAQRVVAEHDAATRGRVPSSGSGGFVSPMGRRGVAEVTPRGEEDDGGVWGEGDEEERLEALETAAEAARSGELVMPPALAAAVSSMLRKGHPRHIAEDLVILDRLGAGAGGAVHRALHVPSLTLVAVKNVPIFDTERRKQMASELRTLYSNIATLGGEEGEGGGGGELEESGVLADGWDDDEAVNAGGACPHIVSFYDAYSDPAAASVNIVMEYLAGGSLQDAVESGGIQDAGELRAVARGLLRGVAHLHANKQLHRDIKPANVLRSASGMCKLADFGIAKQLEGTAGLAVTWVGTMVYMAPERIGDTAEGYSFPSDIWSIGLTLLAAAIGRFPYEDTSYWALTAAIAEEPPPLHLLDAHTTVSPQMKDLIAQCLRRNPEDRPTARQLLNHPLFKAPAPSKPLGAAATGGQKHSVDEVRTVAKVVLGSNFQLFAKYHKRDPRLRIHGPNPSTSSSSSSSSSSHGVGVGGGRRRGDSRSSSLTHSAVSVSSSSSSASSASGAVEGEEEFAAGGKWAFMLGSASYSAAATKHLLHHGASTGDFGALAKDGALVSLLSHDGRAKLREEMTKAFDAADSLSSSLSSVGSRKGRGRSSSDAMAEKSGAVEKVGASSLGSGGSQLLAELIVSKLAKAAAAEAERRGLGLDEKDVIAAIASEAGGGKEEEEEEEEEGGRGGGGGEDGEDAGEGEDVVGPMGTMEKMTRSLGRDRVGTMTLHAMGPIAAAANPRMRAYLLTAADTTRLAHQLGLSVDRVRDTFNNVLLEFLSRGDGRRSMRSGSESPFPRPPSSSTTPSIPLPSSQFRTSSSTADTPSFASGGSTPIGEPIHRGASGKAKPKKPPPMAPGGLSPPAGIQRRISPSPFTGGPASRPTSGGAPKPVSLSLKHSGDTTVHIRDESTPK